MVSSDAPLQIFSDSCLFVLMMSLSLCVKSSSRRCPFSSIILGRTAGGGTGKTVHIIHSGLFHFGLNPIISISFSVMRENILRISSAVNSWTTLSANFSPFLFADCFLASFHSAIIFIEFSLTYLVGWTAPQPTVPSSPQTRILVVVLQSLK